MITHETAALIVDILCWFFGICIGLCVLGCIGWAVGSFLRTMGEYDNDRPVAPKDLPAAVKASAIEPARAKEKLS